LAASHNILLFGGTFDPIHNGHLNVAMAVQDRFHFNRFIFLPCKIPLLKDKAQASPEQRLNMLRLALGEHSDYPFEIDERELHRAGPSYTVITLDEYRNELGADASINFLMGTDSYTQLPQWHESDRILNLANLLVVNRPGHAPLETTVNLNAPHGQVCGVDAGLHDISSTSIRLGSNQDQAIPESVKKYIHEQGLYR